MRLQRKKKKKEKKEKRGLHTQKNRKKNERGVTDTDHSQNVLKLKKEDAVWRRLCPQAAQ